MSACQPTDSLNLKSHLLGVVLTGSRWGWPQKLSWTLQFWLLPLVLIKRKATSAVDNCASSLSPKPVTLLLPSARCPSPTL